MPSLPKPLRNQLEKTIVEARDVAEAAARAALQALAVDQPKPFDHMSPDARRLRVRLRERGRAAGDLRGTDKRQSFDHLAQVVAYEHWHRMLFARFLAENHLLLEPEYQVPVSLEDVRDLAREENRDVWEQAGSYAQRMLPGVFRDDEAALEVTLAREDRLKLEGLLAALDPSVFTADDSLGWTYQFWQSKRKKEVNESGSKIGADEISPVTQLFTEDYMVEFLIDNTLGAWWAEKRMRGAITVGGARPAPESSHNQNNPERDAPPPSDFRTSEDTPDALSEVRKMSEVPQSPANAEIGAPVSSHSALRTPHSALEWRPAAGNFASWPETSKQIRTLDPCMGSAHFLVFLLPVLARLRMEEENLSAPQAVAAVLRDNLHGLEIDERCCQIGAFNLALAAWKLGGYQKLPALHIACSGQAPNADKPEWKALAEGQPNLALALDWLHDSFQKAPELGSLINPKRGPASKLASGGELMRVLSKALKTEADETAHESAVVAQGIAKAAELLGDQYTWVVTNVPYLARGKQDRILQDFCQEHYERAKNDLATVFLERCLELCARGGTTSVVMPQNWLFLTSYRKFREQLLQRDTWHLIARLGPGAFQTISGEVVNAILLNISRGGASVADGGLFEDTTPANMIRGVDAADPRTLEEKIKLLLSDPLKSVDQAKQLENPDARVALEEKTDLNLLSTNAISYQGITTGDNPRFIVSQWEVDWHNLHWRTFQSTGDTPIHFGGRHQVFCWEDGKGFLANSDAARIQGQSVWNKKGIAVRQMRHLPPTINTGSPWDMNCATLVPGKTADLPAIWCYCSSPEYNEAVRRIDQKLNVTNATLVKVPFDLDHWQKVADEKYPHGLPEPYSDDPTQWIFHGHPFGSVIWDEASKRTAHGPLRADASVLQVAVARLLGYRWPAELDPNMELAPEQREWVRRCEPLQAFADPDGIVCLSPLRGEAKASERLRKLLDKAINTMGGARPAPDIHMEGARPAPDIHMEGARPAPESSQMQNNPERDAPPPNRFFNPHLPIDKHENDLPHWQQGEAWIFITFRMGDSLPMAKLKQWREERETWLTLHPEPWDEETAIEYHAQFTERIQMWLDAGEGSCVLKDPEPRNIVENALLHFENQRYELGDFVIMPNHVHVLIRPMGEHTLPDILHSWKSYTAKEINRLLGKSGAFWQEDYWDRLVRSPKHLAYCRRYIADNPGKAYLKDGEYSLFIMGEAKDMGGAKDMEGARPAPESSQMQNNPERDAPPPHIPERDAPPPRIPAQDAPPPHIPARDAPPPQFLGAPPPQVLDTPPQYTWNERDLIAATGSRKRSLEDWLRDDFFAQHCKLFQHRPFVWHIWDGQADGFHALVNYHKLAAPDGAGARLLDTLTHAYLGDWIRRQKDDAQNDVPGARDRLTAAEALHAELCKIQAGEPPYDLFIRWKPLHQQPLGWNPDLNDGVRLNIRPFLSARDVGKKDAGLLRAKPNVKWSKDRGTEPHRDKTDFPWFWGWDEKQDDFSGGPAFDGNRWNDLHYSVKKKEEARIRQQENGS